MQFTALEIIVIIAAFLIMFALLRLFKGDTLADKKRQEIETKRAALIAKRKAAAAVEAKAKAEAKTGEQASTQE